MLSLRDLTYTEIAIRIVLSVLFGGILGMERGMKNRGAGLRTYMLVCLGSCVVMMTNQFLYQSYQSGDPARLGAQVINGIGFLGAGTIIVTKRNQIKGLTTAAGLWASACAGLALGIGLYAVAAPACLSIFVIFTVLHELDFRMRRKSRQIDAFVELRKNTSIRDFWQACANRILIRAISFCSQTLPKASTRWPSPSRSKAASHGHTRRACACSGHWEAFPTSKNSENWKGRQSFQKCVDQR